MSATVQRMTDAEIFAYVEEHDRRMLPGERRSPEDIGDDSDNTKQFRSSEALAKKIGEKRHKIERCRFVIDDATEADKQLVRDGYLTIYAAMAKTKKEQAEKEQKPVEVRTDVANGSSSNSPQISSQEVPLNSQAPTLSSIDPSLKSEPKSLEVKVAEHFKRGFRIDKLPEDLLASIASEIKAFAPNAPRHALAGKDLEALLARQLKDHRERLQKPTASPDKNSLTRGSHQEPERHVLFEGVSGDGRRVRIVLEQLDASEQEIKA